MICLLCVARLLCVCQRVICSTALDTRISKEVLWIMRLDMMRMLGVNFHLFLLLHGFQEGQAVLVLIKHPPKPIDLLPLKRILM